MGRFKWEMLDELPMLLLVLCAVISKDDTHWFMSGVWKHLVHLVCFTVCLGGTYLYLSGGNYEFFLHTFALLHVLWHALAGLACYFGILGDIHNRYAALGVGCAVDAPEAMVK